MHETSGKIGRPQIISKINSHKVGTHVIAGCTDIVRTGTCAQTPRIVIQSPALDLARIHQRAGVMGTCGKLDGHAIQVCERQIISHVIGLVSLLRGIPLTQLAVVIATPALDTAIGNQSAGVFRTCHNLSRSEIGTQVGKCQRFTHVIGLVSLLRVILLTQLPIVIVTPTLDQSLD